MKIFHLSDLHIGLKLMNHDLREDQEYILHQIVERAREEKPHAILIAGDIYDKAVPAAEAVEVFDRFINELTEMVPEAVIMMISGNHDSAPRVNCFRSILSRQHLYMIGKPPETKEEYIEKVTLTDKYGKVNFYLLPFVKPSMVKQIVGTDENDNNLSYDATLHKLLERENVNEAERNVLVSHQFYLPAGKAAEDVERMDSEIRTVGNIDEVSADVLERFDYAALGHIHKPMTVGKECYRYCGTPLACSVSEAGQKKGIIMVELEEKGRLSTRVIPLKPLRQVRIVEGELEEVLKQPSDNFVTVILTDKVDVNVFDMQDRLRHAFPNLLEIRRETLHKANYEMEKFRHEAELDAFSLCCEFIGEMNEEEREILKEVINKVGRVSYETINLGNAGIWVLWRPDEN